MIVASSMSLLQDSRCKKRSGLLPWTLLIIGSAASLAANVVVAEPSVVGRLIAGWPSFALIGSYELLMRQIKYANSENSELEKQCSYASHVTSARAHMSFGESHTPPSPVAVPSYGALTILRLRLSAQSSFIPMVLLTSRILQTRSYAVLLGECGDGVPCRRAAGERIRVSTGRRGNGLSQIALLRVLYRRARR